MTGNANGTEEPPPAPSTALTIHQPSSAALTSSQTGNIVHGHMGGRDVNVYAPEGDIHITQQLPSPNSRSVFRKLFDKLENEAATDRTLTTYIRQLEIYTRRVEDEKVIGLEQKLKMAGREHQVSMAVALKESVYADIKTNVFSWTYQLIVATLKRSTSDLKPRYVR